MYPQYPPRSSRKAPSGRLARIAILVGAALLSTLITMVARAEVKAVAGLRFTQVQLMGSNQLELTQGAENSLLIRGDSEDLDPVPFQIHNGTLLLGVTGQGKAVNGLKFKLTTSELESLLMQGSGEIYVKPLAVEDFVATVEGSGTIRMFDVQALDLEFRVMGSGVLQAVDVKARNARLIVKGSGDIQLGTLVADVIKGHLAGSGDISVEDGGEAGLVEARVMGSGDVAMENVTATEAKVTIMGSGDVHLRVSEKLGADIMGSGDLIYGGSPEVSSSILGSGDVEKSD